MGGKGIEYTVQKWVQVLGHLGHLGQARHAQHDQTSVDPPGGGCCDVYYNTVRLGQMDERLLRVEDALGRRVRNPKV